MEDPDARRDGGGLSLGPRVRRRCRPPRIIADDYVMPYSWQSSIGFQKQLGPVMGFDVDLTDLEERNQVRSRDPNLFYDPVTGYNLDPTMFGRPNPTYGQVQWMESNGKTETVLLSSSFTRRFKNNFQGGVTYTRTLSKQRQHDRLRLSGRQPVRPGCATGRDRPTSSATRSGRTGSSTCRGR